MTLAPQPSRPGRQLVAVWSPGYARGFGGAEQVVNALLRRLSAAGVPTLLITSGNRHSSGANAHFVALPEAVDVHVDSFSNPLLSSGPVSFVGNVLKYGAASLRLWWRFRRRAPAIVHLHVVSVDVFLLIALRALFGYRLIVTFHGSDLDVARVSGLARWKVRAAVRSADAVTTVSSQMASRLREEFRYAGATCIPNGIDVDRARSVAAETDSLVARDQLVYVGRLHPLKRVPLMIQAFRSSVDAGCDRSLYVIGDGEDRPLVERVIAEHELQERVALVGALTHGTALACLAGARALLLFSRSEGCPAVVLEAMALGVPVIAADVGGVAELVVHGRTGFLFPPDDLRAASEYIARLAADRPAAEAMGRAAAAVVRERFDFDASFRDYVSLYERFRQAAG